jgi:phospholipase A1
MKRKTGCTRSGSYAGHPILLSALILASFAAAASEQHPDPEKSTKEESTPIQKDTGGEPSYFTRLWELDKNTRRGSYTITPHRSNYFLPFTYNCFPNRVPLRQADPDRDMKNSEVAFQLSLKIKLWEDILSNDMDLWVGYTQRSFWQLYNFEDSSPFRDTNYEPELLLNFRTDYDILGFKGRFITAGINHQSNGQSNPLSRSWNRLVASIGFEKNNFSFLVTGWYRIPEDDQNDDNPRMEKYLGYGELRAYYFWKNNRFGLMVRNNLRGHDNHGAAQLDWSFPLFKKVGGYVQYFYGYGESLLDYNHRVSRIGVGFILQ